MDYFTLLNLAKEPFANSPDPDYFFQSQQHLGCLQKLELSLRLRRGLNVVIGDVGTGKTTLCRQLLRRFATDTQVATHLMLDPSCDNSHGFLRTVSSLLVEGEYQPPESATEHELKEGIKQALFRQGVDQEQTVILIIDEGQKLPSFAIETLREFLNYETNEHKLLQIAIFAQREFTETLQEHANFTDRISLYHELAPMNLRDTIAMIQFRLAQASRAETHPMLFTKPALWAIYRATHGYPRKIVNLCHQSMLSVIIQNRTRATWRIVRSCLQRSVGLHNRRRWPSVAAAAMATLIGCMIWLNPMPSLNHLSFGPTTLSGLTTGNFPTGPYTAPHPELLPKDAVQASVEIEAIAPDRDASLQAVATPESVPDRTAAPFRVPYPNPEVVSASPAPAERKLPQVLGQTYIAADETLGKLILQVYGTYTPRHLRKVLEANPQIQNPDQILAGRKIYFPGIPHPMPAQRDPAWRIELASAKTIDDALEFLRRRQANAPACRLLPFWTPNEGLQFSIVLKNRFKNLNDAQQQQARLSDSDIAATRVVKLWQPETVFFANPL